MGGFLRDLEGVTRKDTDGVKEETVELKNLHG